MNTTYQQIINSISEGLYINPSVYAFWLEGSHAHGIADEYSDIDLWFDVEDGKEDNILCSIRDIVSAIAPIDYDQQAANPHPQIWQSVLHLTGTPEFMRLDICIQSHSRDICFAEGFVDQKIKVLFDKCGIIRYSATDWQALKNEQFARAKELMSSYTIAQSNLRKELARRNFLEALNYYHNDILKPLIEVLRIRHQPTKQEFHLKHIYRDLPEDIISIMEDLYAVKCLEDIEAKWRFGDCLFKETVDDISKLHDCPIVE